MEKIKIKKENFLKFNSFHEAVDNIFNKIDDKTALIIDIDGVLLEMDIKIFLQGLNLITSKEKFENFLEKHKISFSNLKALKEIIEKGAKVILFTDRFKTLNKNFFPFISQETISRFKESGIEIISHPKFLLKLPKELLDKIEENEKIFYIGSGKIDELLFKKLRSVFVDKNLEYLQISSKSKLI
jgi:ribonucleotide monophosphatase NagD (HAD superfamily)